MSKKYKLAALTSHPIQYQAPLFRKLAEHPEIDLTVYFCWDFGVEKEQYDPGFGKEIKWDVPLLEGYKYKFLPNLSLKPSSSFFGQINPSIIKELHKNRYDAIWVHGYASLTNWLVFLGAWVSRTPIMLRGESQLLRRRSLWIRVLKKVLLTPLFRTLSVFLAIGTLNKEYYLHYRVPEKKIFPVPYVVDDNFFNKQKEKWETKHSEVKKELGIIQNAIVILYVGKIFGAKGPGAFDLLRAFEKLKDSHLVNLIFVGDGKEKPLLEEYVKKRGIKNVLFTGFENQTELPKYYNVADILVLPSYTEQWGIVINEAMYFDTAIIASDQVGAAYDLVHNGGNGYTFTVGNADFLASCLEKVVNDRKLLQSMKIESGRIIRGWNLETCVSGILAALNYLGRK